VPIPTNENPNDVIPSLKSSVIVPIKPVRAPPRMLDLFADDNSGPEMELSTPGGAHTSPVNLEPVTGVDLSGKKKIIFWVGRGKTGKTTGIRWMAEKAVAGGTPLLMADLDPTNDTFSKYIENVGRPSDASDPAISLKWLDKMLQHALRKQSSLLVDLGGGDTTLRRLVTQLPDLVEMFEAANFAVILLYTVGPQEEDLSPLATLQNLDFKPTAAAIILNEGLVEVGDMRETAFARITNHSAFRKALANRAVPVWMPRLLPAQQVEIRRMHFRDAANGGTGIMDTPLGVFDRSRLMSWLDKMDANLDGIKSWLP
jgi:hypothetical protein